MYLPGEADPHPRITFQSQGHTTPIYLFAQPNQSDPDSSLIHCNLYPFSEPTATGSREAGTLIIRSISSYSRSETATATTVNMVSANHIAYTERINPAAAATKLSIEQVWPLLQRKVRRAQEFVPAGITSTTVLSTSTTPSGLPVTVREAVFLESGRRVREECIEYFPIKVEFHQPDGSKVENIISEGPDGELYMTYTFEWLHPELEGDDAGLQQKREQETKLAKMAVQSTLKAMREMVEDGRWKEAA